MGGPLCPHKKKRKKRLMNLGNKEILGKYQIWVEALRSPQSPLQKFNFCNSSQRTRKSRYQSFLYLPRFTRYLYLVPNILPKIVWTNKVVALTWLSFLQIIFFYFVYNQRISSIFREIIKTISYAKLPNLIILCKQYYAYLF